MAYHFGIVHLTDREVVLKESRNLDALIGAAIAATIAGLALARLAASGEWGAFFMVGAVELWCIGLLLMGAAESTITVSRDRMVIDIVRNISRARVSRTYELDQVQRFYEITASLRGGGGKGLRAELLSGKKITLSLWARSGPLRFEVLALTALSSPLGRKGGASRHRSA